MSRHSACRFVGRAAWAALLAWGCLVGSALTPECACAWSEFGEVPEKPREALTGPEIREPFFEFLISMTRTDSLGSWTGAQLRDHARQLARPSKFPLPELVAVSRARPDSTADARYPGVPVRAIWHIVLTGKQDRAMPYSILGYHPGSLRIASELVLVELDVGDITLSLPHENRTADTEVEGLVVLALEQGFVVLDADGWLDALLGAGLDDAWTLGFAIGRADDRLVGLGVSLGRKGRHIYGEFDFAADKVLAHGRPLASALSRLSRTWLTPESGHLPTPWLEP